MRWTPLENDNQPVVAFSWPAAIFAVLWLAGTTLLWYQGRKSGFSQSWMAAPTFVVGSALFMAVLVKSTGMAWKDLSKETVLVLGCSLLFFALVWLFGRRSSYPFDLTDVSTRMKAIYTFFYFAATCFIGRMVLPYLLARFVLHRPMSDYGYRFKGTFRNAWVYAVSLGLAVPMVWWASTQPSFVQKYPLVKTAIESNTLSIELFVVYHLAYGLVFVSGESFWRGFILFGTGRQLGKNALFLMLIPYVAAHFGKPVVETLGAILAGLFLGYLAWEHRSFWLGVALHWGVALMMDLFALYRRGVTMVWAGSGG